jgi:hypothetical protein
VLTSLLLSILNDTNVPFTLAEWPTSFVHLRVTLNGKLVRTENPRPHISIKLHPLHFLFIILSILKYNSILKSTTIKYLQFPPRFLLDFLQCPVISSSLRKIRGQIKYMPVLPSLRTKPYFNSNFPFEQT